MTRLATLESLQDMIHAGNGTWGVAAREAAQVPSFGGDAAGARILAQGWQDAAAVLESAQEALAAVERAEVAGVWAGEAQTAAVEVVRALADEVSRAVTAFRDAAGVLGSYGDGLESAAVRDRAGRQALHEAPRDGIDLRVAAHIAARDNAEDLAVGLHDLAGQAEGHRLALGAVDGMLVADTEVLTPAMAGRASAALAARAGEHDVIMAGATSEQRAYLLKALAAGYRGASLAAFGQAVAPHDDAWLERQVDPLSWSQGPFPTCVAAATVTAHAEVDPVYALNITSTPGRLRAEQQRVYDGGRSWVQDVLGLDGMTPEQAERVANEEIAPRTGRGYESVAFAEGMLADIERAVDDGYPVPFITAGHQQVVIGHTGDHLRIYNPWGNTYWMSEQEFTAAAPLVGFPA
jgi:hypothetical protein